MASLNIKDLFSVKGMVFVITGGGSGLGATMAHALAANGASKVFILGRRQKSLEAVAMDTKPVSIILCVGHVKIFLANRLGEW